MTSEKVSPLRARMIDDMRLKGMGDKAPTFNTRIVALRFLFAETCGREDMKRYLQYRTQPRKLPTVLSIEDVAEILKAAPGPGLKYRAALSVSYGTGLRASEVCSLRVGDIDSEPLSGSYCV